MIIPKVFISYSHDSLEHKKWVLDLGIRLRNNGIDAILDQWELTAGDDLPHFMETNLAIADYIIMICTERYVLKANQGTGGVGYEKMIITSNLMSKINENKIIPLIRQNGSFLTPTFLKTKLFIDFSKKDDYEFSFDELIRKIHKSPIYIKPILGNNPFNSISSDLDETHQPKRTSTDLQKTALIELMKIVALDYESGKEYTIYKDLYKRIGISRIMLDILTAEALTKKLIKKDNAGDLVLIDEGKFFAIENNILE